MTIGVNFITISFHNPHSYLFRTHSCNFLHLRLTPVHCPPACGLHCYCSNDHSRVSSRSRQPKSFVGPNISRCLNSITDDLADLRLIVMVIKVINFQDLAEITFDLSVFIHSQVRRGGNPPTLTETQRI